MAQQDRATNDELRILIQKVARRIKAERSDEHVTDSQLGVLWRLEKLGACTPGQLADLEKVRPPSMNRTVNALEEAGYVERSPAPDDARKVLVNLTESGRRVTTETRRLRAVWFEHQLAALGEEENAALAAVIPILRRIAES